MACGTSSQIVSRLGNHTAVQLTTDSGSSVDATLINTIIAEVEGKINMAVRSRMAETINHSDHPKSFAMLRGLATVMVIARLAAGRPPVSETWQADSDRAEKWLEKPAEGKVDLPDVTLNEPGIDWGTHDQNAAAER